ncbi:hypothetical protein JHW43_009595, partial [Diplocarpon mali]
AQRVQEGGGEERVKVEGRREGKVEVQVQVKGTASRVEPELRPARAARKPRATNAERPRAIQSDQERPRATESDRERPTTGSPGSREWSVERGARSMKRAGRSKEHESMRA